MSEAFLLKMYNDMLMPATAKDREAFDRIKIGDTVRVSFTRVRNYEFHKKYFALLQFAFEHWEPPEADVPAYISAHGITPQKNFERFRKDVAILAGFYESSFRINGEVRLEAKSIAFGNMSEEEFEELYSKSIDVIIKRCLNNYTGAELRSVVEQVEAFE